MYLYHHPDIWYDYAMWHVKNGSMDSASKIFQRALKAIHGNLFRILLISSLMDICSTSQCTSLEVCI
jgi:hypothetical protein